MAQTKSKIPRLVNHTEGVDHLVPSYFQSDIGWNTGVGKNCAVCEGISVMMFNNQGSQINNACFFALIVARYNLLRNYGVPYFSKYHHVAKKQTITVIAL